MAKTITCNICGSAIVPVHTLHYIARDNGERGMSAVFKSSEEVQYDAFDCPVCGCQMIAQERKRAASANDYPCDGDYEEEDDDEDN